MSTQSTPFKRVFWATIIGNILDHYDTALYGLLAPIFAPLFFPNQDHTVSLILTYLVLATSMLSKPLGALYFGRKAHAAGAKQGLILSLFGLSLTTGLMGSLPTYSSVGAIAPLMLTVLRMAQGFFAAGEQGLAGLYLVEQAKESIQGKVSSAFQTSTVVGIILASAIASLVTPHPTLWRLPFLGGCLTASIGIALRHKLPEKPSIQLSRPPILRAIWSHHRALIRTIFASGFTYLTYSVPFVFLNAFVPLVSTVSLTTMLKLNTLLLLFDALCLPLFGAIADRIGKKRTMGGAALLLALTIIPLFQALINAGPWTVTFIRVWIVILGLAFLAPLHAWYLQQFPTQERYLLTGIGYSMGSTLFGKTTPAICLYLWHTFHTPLAPAGYIALVCLAVGCATTVSNRKIHTVDSRENI